MRKHYILLLLTVISVVFLPTSCKRELELEASSQAKFTRIAGQIILPENTSWSPDELRIQYPMGEAKISNSNYTIEHIQNEGFQLLFAVYPNDKIAFICPHFPNNKELNFDSESSALGILMINPLTNILSEKGKIDMAENIRKSEKFPALVQIIDECIRNRKSFLEDDGVSEVIASIFSDFIEDEGKSESRKSGILDDRDIGVVLNMGKNGSQPGSLRLINYGSSLTYIASIENVFGREVARINMGRVSVKLIDVFVGIWNKLEYLVGLGPEKWIEFQEPEPQYYQFTDGGKYLLTITNSKGADNDSGVKSEANLETLKDLLSELTGTVSFISGQFIKHSDCAVEIGLNLANNSAPFIVNGVIDPEKLREPENVIAYVDMVGSMLLDTESCLGANATSSDVIFQRKYIMNALEIVKKINVVSQLISTLGTGVNTGLMISGALRSTPFYQKCLDFNKDGDYLLKECREEEIPEEEVPDETEYIPTSVSTGDPHLTTLDGLRYSFMAVGEFIALKSTSDQFEVQARQEEVKSKNNSGLVSFNTGIAINTGSDIVCIYPPNQVYVNRQSIGFSFENHTLRNGGSIRRNGSQLYVRNGTNDQVEVRLFNTDLDYYITLSPSRKGRVRGVLGNYDGNPANDLVTANNTVIGSEFGSLYPNFSNSWRIKQNESLFIYEAGKTTASYTDESFPKAPISLTQSQTSRARSICEQQGITDPVTLENCILDVALTNDNSYAERALQGEKNNLLDNFSIGDFSRFTNDVSLFDARLNNGDIDLNDLNCSGNCNLPTVFWMQKLDFTRGFETEIEFTATKVQTNANDNILGICGLENPVYTSPSVYASSLSGVINSASQKNVANRFSIRNGTVNGDGNATLNRDLFDGRRHKVRIVMTRNTQNAATSGNCRLFIDGNTTPAVSFSYSQQTMYQNILFPAIYGENVRIHSWKMKAL